MECAITFKFNSKESVVMISKSKEDQEQTVPTSFSWQIKCDVFWTKSNIRVSDGQCEDHDVQCCKVYTRAAVLAPKKKFHTGTINGNVLWLAKAYRTPLYTAHMWRSYSPAKLRKLQVVHNDAFRIQMHLMKLPRWSSANHMSVSRNVPPSCSVWKIVCLNLVVD